MVRNQAGDGGEQYGMLGGLGLGFSLVIALGLGNGGKGIDGNVLQLVTTIFSLGMF